MKCLDVLLSPVSQPCVVKLFLCLCRAPMFSSPISVNWCRTVDVGILIMSLHSIRFCQKGPYHSTSSQWLDSKSKDMRQGLGCLLVSGWSLSSCLNVKVPEIYYLSQAAALFWCLTRQEVWTNNLCYICSMNYFNWLWEQKRLETILSCWTYHSKWSELVVKTEWCCVFGSVFKLYTSGQ